MPKRKAISIDLKLKIIERLNAGEKQADLAREYELLKSTTDAIFKKQNDSIKMKSQCFKMFYDTRG